MRDQGMGHNGKWSLLGGDPLRALPAGRPDLVDAGYSSAHVPPVRRPRGTDHAGIIHLRSRAWAPWPLCREPAGMYEPADVLLALVFEPVPSATSMVTCLFCARI